MGLHDARAGLLVGQLALHLAVDAAGAEQRGVEDVDAVGRGDHLRAGCEAVGRTPREMVVVWWWWCAAAAAAAAVFRFIISTSATTASTVAVAHQFFAIVVVAAAHQFLAIVVVTAAVESPINDVGEALCRCSTRRIPRQP